MNEDIDKEANTRVRNFRGKNVHLNSPGFSFEFLHISLDNGWVTWIEKDIQGGVLQWILFSDDVLLVDENFEDVNGRLKEYRQALKGLRISRGKMENEEENGQELVT